MKRAFRFCSRVGTFLPGLLSLLMLASCNFGTPIHGGGGTEGEGLSGTLVDGAGSPVGSAWVRAYPADSSASALGKAGAADAVNGAASLAVDSALTNPVGAFRLTRLVAGTYNLAASVRREDTTLTVFIPGVVYSGGRRNLGVDTLRPAGSASLQVYADAGLLVGAVCSVPGSPYHAVSDSSGNCIFAELPQGAFIMKVSYGGYPVTVSGESYVYAGEHTSCGAVALSADGPGIHIPAP